MHFQISPKLYVLRVYHHFGYYINFYQNSNRMHVRVDYDSPQCFIQVFSSGNTKRISGGQKFFFSKGKRIVLHPTISIVGRVKSFSGETAPLSPHVA
jgi:hypothetical protein